MYIAHLVWLFLVKAANLFDLFERRQNPPKTSLSCEGMISEGQRKENILGYYLSLAFSSSTHLSSHLKTNVKIWGISNLEFRLYLFFCCSLYCVQL